MNCQHIHELLTSYILGDLNKADTQSVETHLAECSDCRATKQELETTLELLQGALAATHKAPATLTPEHKKRVLASKRHPAIQWIVTPNKKLSRIAAILVVGFVGMAIIRHYTLRSMYRELGSQTSTPCGRSLPMPSTWQYLRNKALSPLKMSELVSGVDEHPASSVVMMEMSARPSASPSAGELVIMDTKTEVLNKTGIANDDVSSVETGGRPGSDKSKDLGIGGGSASGFEISKAKSPLVMNGLYSSRSASASGGKIRSLGGKPSPETTRTTEGWNDSGTVQKDSIEHRPVDSDGDGVSEVENENSERMVPLKIKLPKPLFQGTPASIRGVNLDPQASQGYDYRERSDSADGLEAETPAAPATPHMQPPASATPVMASLADTGMITRKDDAELAHKTAVHDFDGEDQKKPIRVDQIRREMSGDNDRRKELQRRLDDYEAMQQDERNGDVSVAPAAPAKPAAPSFKSNAAIPDLSGKSGSGALTLTGDNSYSGGTTVSGGKLEVQEEKTPRLGNIPILGRMFQSGKHKTSKEAPALAMEYATREPTMPMTACEPPMGNEYSDQLKTDVSGGGTYTIQPGDTLSKIAKKTGTPVVNLKALNDIRDPNKIKAGHTIVIAGTVAPAFGAGDSRHETLRQQIPLRPDGPRRDTGGGVADRSDKPATESMTTLTKAITDSSMFDAVSQPDKDLKDDALTGPVFKAYGQNPFVATAKNPFSTFSIDVDTASYTVARNYMLKGFLPPAEAVRTEEFVNFFNYAYKQPTDKLFAIYADCAPTPFERGLHVLKIGVEGKRLAHDEKRPAVLTLLIDTSGSMSTADRLGLLTKSLHLLIDKLDPKDQVAIIQYDSHARLVLDSTPVSEKARILAALDGLQTSGSTNLEEGMREGYKLAARRFVANAVNRVLLLSDGAANLGSIEAPQILNEIESYRKQGIYCSVFGFGMGTYNDDMLKTIASKGDGTYAFIDSIDEAKRVFVDQLTGTLNTIAADVKIQVEFNPDCVKRYRQLGYEERQLKKDDFRNDSIDAGEVGSGQSVTALYQVELQGKQSGQIGTIRVRYRNTATGRIEELERGITALDIQRSFESADARFKLAAAVAEFSEVLRGSDFAKGHRYADIAAVLRPAALELNLDNRVQELLGMIQSAESMPRAGMK